MLVIVTIQEGREPAAAVSLYFRHYNFGRVHQSLGKLTTPAMATGISDHVWPCEEIAVLLDSSGKPVGSVGSLDCERCERLSLWP